jgi:DNA-directed RNA polymerase specialized sigma24 family protein
MGTVMSRLHRARKALRDLLRKNHEGGRHGM